MGLSAFAIPGLLAEGLGGRFTTLSSAHAGLVLTKTPSTNGINE